jgi:predicted nucleotidyltransferase
MLKEGKFRAYRNLPIGWLTHANHGRDLTERLFHWAMEIFFLLLVSFVLLLFKGKSFIDISIFASVFIIVHTLWWVVNGNFHVYLLDSFKCIQNPGIQSVVNYLLWVTLAFKKNEAVDAVLVYGSFCRSKFHNRSDLDLRVIRSIHSQGTFKLLFLGIFARIVSFYRQIPTDLQIVDSIQFLEKQMRSDELPVVLYCRNGFIIERAGIDFESIKKNSDLVLKKT